MFCPRCGKDNPPVAKFCNECGFSLQKIGEILTEKLPGTDGTEEPGTGNQKTVEQPAVPVKKEDPKKPFVRLTSPLPEVPSPQEPPQVVQPEPVPSALQPVSTPAPVTPPRIKEHLSTIGKNEIGVSMNIEPKNNAVSDTEPKLNTPPDSSVKPIDNSYFKNSDEKKSYEIWKKKGKISLKKADIYSIIGVFIFGWLLMAVYDLCGKKNWYLFVSIIPLYFLGLSNIIFLGLGLVIYFSAWYNIRNVLKRYEWLYAEETKLAP